MYSGSRGELISNWRPRVGVDIASIADRAVRSARSPHTKAQLASTGYADFVTRNSEHSGETRVDTIGGDHVGHVRDTGTVGLG